jgi:hypothetical protein
MATADLVEWKGWAFPFQCCNQRMMGRSRRPTLSKLPRRMACPVVSANQRTIRFSHEALLGVEWR